MRYIVASTKAKHLHTALSLCNVASSSLLRSIAYIDLLYLPTDVIQLNHTIICMANVHVH